MLEVESLFSIDSASTVGKKKKKNLISSHFLMMSLNLLCPVVCVVAKYEFNKDDKVTDFFHHSFFFIFESLLKKKSRHREIVA